MGKRLAKKTSATYKKTTEQEVAVADTKEKTENYRAHRLEKEIEIAASIEEVWAALTDGKKLAN